MRRACTFLLLLGLGLAIANCSRCDIPTWRSQACHGDVPATGG